MGNLIMNISAGVFLSCVVVIAACALIDLIEEDIRLNYLVAGVAIFLLIPSIIVCFIGSIISLLGY